MTYFIIIAVMIFINILTILIYNWILKFRIYEAIVKDFRWEFWGESFKINKG
jgi:hypothetical protein